MKAILGNVSTGRREKENYRKYELDRADKPQQDKGSKKVRGLMGETIVMSDNLAEF